MRLRHALVAAAVLVAGCAATAPAPDVDAAFQHMMSSSFSDKGIARVDRLHQDESDAACSRAAGGALADAEVAAILEKNAATVKPPADGRYLGDWRMGEALAQDGKGMTWSDPSTAPAANGGSCYNCHQIGPKEIAYGTIGPSLYHYLANHGASDPDSAQAQQLVRSTWAKIYNAKATSPCSAMPRFGAAGILDEAQMKNLMALLLDPESPVNR